jgi:glycosyltransferase involved in cell wall biosynthesis
LTYANLVGHYTGVIWKASFDSEKQEIRDVMGKDVDILVAPDLVPRSIISGYTHDLKPKKEIGSVRFVFISRIVPKKNLAFFLERLLEIDKGYVEFDIIGPPEDLDYWQQCQALIERLPSNIKVNVIGGCPWNEALQYACKSHFFVLPTLNENFGYVFIEGLSAGCPLLISDQNVWTDVDEKALGWRIPLDQPQRFVDQINKCIAMDDDEFSDISRRARQYAVEWIARPEINEATARVLSRALNEEARSVSDGR